MTTKTKTTISGTPRNYDEAELKKLQEGYHAVYKQTDQCTELVKSELPHDFLAKIVEFSKQGYMLSKYPINMEMLNYFARMIKPETLQTEDLARIDDKIKQEYITELETEREQYRQLLTKQLLQAAEAKEAKKIDDVQKKRMLEIEKEVNDVFGKLELPA